MVVARELLGAVPDSSWPWLRWLQALRGPQIPSQLSAGAGAAAELDSGLFFRPKQNAIVSLLLHSLQLPYSLLCLTRFVCLFRGIPVQNLIFTASFHFVCSIDAVSGSSGVDLKQQSLITCTFPHTSALGKQMLRCSFQTGTSQLPCLPQTHPSSLPLDEELPSW